MLSITLNLVDTDGKVPSELHPEFSGKDTVKNVVQKIQSKWGIEPDLQKLFYKEKQINNYNQSLEDLKVQAGDEIHIKHAFLGQWDCF